MAKGNSFELYIWFAYTSALVGDPWIVIMATTPEILELGKKRMDLLHEWSKHECRKNRESSECKKILEEIDRLWNEMDRKKNELINILKDKTVEVIM